MVLQQQSETTILGTATPQTKIKIEISHSKSVSVIINKEIHISFQQESVGSGLIIQLLLFLSCFLFYQTK